MRVKAKNLATDRWWDVWIAAIALSAILLVATRLWATDWVDDLSILVVLTFFAGITGIALGYSRFPILICSLISTVYGVFFTGWLFGTTVEMEMIWRDRIVYHLGWRLRITITQLIAGDSINDPILFLTMMAVLLWILASVATFVLVREGSFWPSILPLGISLLVISHYDQDLARNTRFLMSFLLMTLLILGRTTFLKYQQKWYREGIHSTEQIRSDLARSLIILSFSLLIISVMIPIQPLQKTFFSDAWNRITNWWYNASDRFSEIFTFESSVQTGPKLGFFNDSMNLGSGAPNNEGVVFDVKVVSKGYPDYRSYWRARSYDYYEDSEWSSSTNLEERFYSPETFNIDFPDWQGGRPAEYTITPRFGTLENLFITGSPTWVSHPVQAITDPITESEEDLVALIARPEVEVNESYQLRTTLTMATVSDLRNSSTDYPEWLDPYLRLPRNFSSKIEALAQNIAQENNNPYSTAYDITRYLRMNIEYQPEMAPIPPGVDPIEWFLFEEQQGFCNYYATAEVLMLRAVGIPARLSVGYAEGTFDLDTGNYLVRENDSHAWPEVYFVGFGWIAFEPTVSQPALFLPSVIPPLEETIERPQLDDQIFPGELPVLPDSEGLPSEDNSPADSGEIPEDVQEDLGSQPKQWVLPAVGILVVITIVIIWIKNKGSKRKFDPLPVIIERRLINKGKSVPTFLKYWSRLARMETPEKAYRRLGQSIKILGQTPNKAETPKERAQTLGTLLPNAKIAISDVVNEYELHQYSNHYSSRAVVKKAARQVHRLAIKARLQRIFSFEERK